MRERGRERESESVREGGGRIETEEYEKMKAQMSHLNIETIV